MNCLPFANRFKSLRRILSKMLPTSRRSSERQNLIDGDKENTRPDDTSSYFPTSSSTSSCGYLELRSPCWSNPFRDDNNNNCNNNTYLSSISDSSQSLSPQSSGYESSWMKPPQPPRHEYSIFKDQSSSFDSMLSPLKSYKSIDESSNFTKSSQSSSSYSPLSSFNSADPKLPSAFYSNFNFDDLSSSLQAENQAFHDALRRDFEMNGKTIDINEAPTTFTPQISSTPMPSRKSGCVSERQAHQKQIPQQRVYQRSPSSQEWSKNKKSQKRRFKPNKKSLEDHCVFCKNNGADEKIYRNHTVKDSMGRVLCPTLRLYRCPICGEDGDKSHTVKYCPKKPIITLEDIQRMDNKV